MAKLHERDSQILVTILKTQNDMQEILNQFESDEEVVKDKKSYDLLYFYTIKILNLMKNLHNKSKKGLTFLDDFVNKLLLSDITYCYPTISPTEFVKYFLKISDSDATDEITTCYEMSITKSKNYQGETRKNK